MIETKIVLFAMILIMWIIIVTLLAYIAAIIFINHVMYPLFIYIDMTIHDHKIKKHMNNKKRE